MYDGNDGRAMNSTEMQNVSICEKDGLSVKRSVFGVNDCDDMKCSDIGMMTSKIMEIK